MVKVLVVKKYQHQANTFGTQYVMQFMNGYGASIVRTRQIDRYQVVLFNETGMRLKPVLKNLTALEVAEMLDHMARIPKLTQ